MKETQRIIRYLAIAFAIFLGITIVYWTVFGVTSVFRILPMFGITNNANANENNQLVTNYLETFKNIENLDIEISVSKLEIKYGTELKVEGKQVSDKFSVKADNNSLKIEEKNENIFNLNKEIDSEIVVYLPDNLKNVKIHSGIGNVKIEKLTAENIDFELGVGATYMEQLIAQNSKIECGAGKVEINESSLNNLDLSTGIGVFNFTGKITGNNKIESGIGKSEIHLVGKPEDYKIKAETGIGLMTLNGESIKKDEIYGNGSTNIEISGGIGKTEITTTER